MYILKEKCSDLLHLELNVKDLHELKVVENSQSSKQFSFKTTSNFKASKLAPT